MSLAQTRLNIKRKQGTARQAVHRRKQKAATERDQQAAHRFERLTVAIREASRKGKLPVEFSSIDDDALLCWEFQAWANDVSDGVTASRAPRLYNQRTGVVDLAK
jgi:hypothetical protein